MCHDRVDGDDLSTTHEFLSLMLGVRRAGVTAALQALDERGLIATKWRRITVLDRAKLEGVAGDSYGVPEAEYARLSSCAADGVGPGLVVQEPARLDGSAKPPDLPSRLYEVLDATIKVQGADFGTIQVYDGRAVQSTPLIAPRTGTPVGMLSTHFRGHHRPSDRDLSLTDHYAQQAADVIAARLAAQRQ